MKDLEQGARHQDARDRRVVVGVDDSPAGLAALRWAVGLARSENSQLVAVRAWKLGLPKHGGLRHRDAGHRHIVLYYNGDEQRIESAKIVGKVFGTAAGGIPRDIALTVATPQGDPAAVLARLAADGDLLVLGTRRGRSIKRLIHGSVSRYCSRHARCPVVIVPLENSASAAAPARTQT
jgi:nucleotide-binding universal stress UspA family protein